MRLFKAEKELRSHLPPEAPIQLIQVWSHDSQQWMVIVKYTREAAPAVIIGSEPLEEFPSELMIAQAMLVV